MLQLTGWRSSRNQLETLIRASDTTEGKQVKKIVDDIALLSEYVRGMQETTCSSEWCQSILASPLLQQYEPVRESQHFREDDRLAKTATASYLQRSQNEKTYQGLAGKVAGWRRDNDHHDHHKCQSKLVVATAETLSGQSGSSPGEVGWCTNKGSWGRLQHCCPLWTCAVEVARLQLSFWHSGTPNVCSNSKAATKTSEYTKMSQPCLCRLSFNKIFLLKDSAKL